MTTLSLALEQEYPDANRNVRARVTPLQDQVVQNVRPALVLLLGAVGLVLLIACANVANLLLARAVAAPQATAIRGAMGAGSGRLLPQLVIEAPCWRWPRRRRVLVAVWGVALLSGPAVSGLPRAQDLGVSGRWSPSPSRWSG